MESRASYKFTYIGDQGAFIKNPEGGRSTSYSLANFQN
jgi:hypothetical protein